MLFNSENIENIKKAILEYDINQENNNQEKLKKLNW
jgi:hypothetical protein